MAETSTKEKLMMAALDLFSRKGYSATSVDEIAEAVGVTGPNIYKYFKGKAAILDSITEMAETGYKERMSLTPGTAIWIHNGEELKQFSMDQIRFTLCDETIIRLRKMYTIEQFRNEFMSNIANLHQYANLICIYTKVFEGMIGYGTLDAEDPEFMALEYIAPVSLLIQLCDREPQRKDEILKRIERHIDFFIARYVKAERLIK